MQRFSFQSLPKAELIVDALYEADPEKKTIAGEPLAPLMSAGNRGGFRFTGSIADPNLVVLYTTLDEPNWPDHLDLENGLFCYFGDNRKPGFDLHDPKAGRGGNLILRRTFELAHAGESGRAKVSPFFVFSRGSRSRDVVFRGLAVPGAEQLTPSSDLVAIWKSVNEERFQNYRAIFTILAVNSISRGWLTELKSGLKLGPNCPEVWRQWVKTGKPKPLVAEKITRVRSPSQQLGNTTLEKEIINILYKYFSKSTAAFENFAADVVRIMDENVISIDVTRPSRDGGRDGVGKYRLGLPQNCVIVEFAVEAKCYATNNGVGVKAISRLISRLRHRQFGVLVTTSYLAEQAYQEIVDDEHPIVVCAGGDVAKLLIAKHGFKTDKQLTDWLQLNYSLSKLEAPG